MSGDTSPSLIVLAAGMARRYGGCKPLAPIGPNGEAVIDLLVSDALAAGFGRVVLVLHPETGPAIRYHVEQSWPDSVDVEFATQRIPLGTVHAVLAAQPALDAGSSFAVSNADDVYGEVSMRLLAAQLISGADEHTLVGYRLRTTVTTDDPVTRGVCEVGDDGILAALTERRHVARQSDGSTFVSEDGLEPTTLDGNLLTSVNLWGFQPEIWKVFGTAMDASGLDEEAMLATLAGGGTVPKAEVLLPEVVASMVSEGSGLPVRVIPTEGKLIGVTHASDVPAVNAELSRQVAWGIRPSQLWGSAV